MGEDEGKKTLGDSPDSTNPYRLFSHCYNALVGPRGHFENQAKYVKALATRFFPGKVMILDAACGMGEVLSLLACDYSSISGVEGSPDMLSHALCHRSLEGVPLACCRWEELGSFFARTGRYELIYFLGNSISHVSDMETFHGIVSSVYHNGLSENGMLVFDSRDWDWSGEEGHMIERGRPIGIETSLGSIGHRRA